MVQEKMSCPINEKEVRSEIEDGLLEHENREDMDDVSAENELCRFSENFLDTSEYIEKNGNESLDEIYESYSKAMSRRDREPLEKDNFIYHFFEDGNTEKSSMYGDAERGYLLGSTKNDVFIVTHFAPKSIRKGYELLKELGESDLPTLMLVTDDLATMLKRMPGWKVEDIEIAQDFLGEPTKKTVVHNNFSNYKEKLQEMAKEYFSEENN